MKNIIFMIVITILLQACATSSPQTKSKHLIGESRAALEEMNIGLKYQKSNDIQNAIIHFKKAANMGLAHAQIMLGIIYSQMDNHIEATKWFLMAATNDDAQAQYEIGKRYYFGIGIDKNESEAISWLSKSVEQNNPNAQYMVGSLKLQKYTKDSKSELPENMKDKTECYDLILKAAEQGHPDAQMGMVIFYSASNDYIEIYKWLTIASQKSKYALRWRDAWDNEGKITQEQKDTAVKLAKIWLEEHPVDPHQIFDTRF